jgi:hypothetical protein
MIFPDRHEDLERRVSWLVERCRQTMRDRTMVYDRRERYFLFGTAGNDTVRYNRIESHIDLVASFLYAPDHAFYNIAAQRNASDVLVKQATALQDEFNDDFHDNGTSDLFSEAIPWALCYNTMHIKQGWNDLTGEGFATLVPPHQFGVFREDLPSLSSQEAFLHNYPLEYHDAVARLVRAGRTSDISRMAVTNQHSESPFPDMLSRMIIAGTGGSNLAGNILGQVNPEYTPVDTYQPQTQHPMVMFNELWAWDSECNDYRIFHLIEPDILVGDSRRTIKAMMASPKYRRLLEDKAKRVPKKQRDRGDEINMAAPGEDDFTISESNLFLPGENPFTKVQPYGKYNYYWGKAHIDSLMSLQDWMNDRFDQIDELLERQAYPPKVGTGMSGLSDEQFDAFGSADTSILEQMPNAKVEELRPDLPEDMFAELKEIGVFFLEASGLTEVISGKGESGVRSRQHAKQLQQTGSGRIKRAALKLEPALVRIGDIALKLKLRNDDDAIIPEPHEGKDGKEISEPFVPAQIATEVKMKISGHAHSPLFVDDAREMAVLLQKAGAIDSEMFTRMLHPPNQDAIIHAQRAKARKQQQMLASLPPELRAAALTGGKSGGGRGRK